MRDLPTTVSLQKEINNLKRQVDNAEWEGYPCEPLKRSLELLIKKQLEGDLWYPEF